MIPAPAHYTDLDFDRLRARLLELARLAFPDWDPDVASLGTTLLEFMAYVGDVLLFRQDQLARESRIVTATQRRALAALAVLVGERLLPPAAATVDLELSLSRPPAVDVVVPAGTIVRTDEAPAPVRFQIVAPVVLRAGLAPAVVVAPAEHSLTHTITITTDGSPELVIALDHAPFLDGSLVVASPQGDFIPVDSFLATGAADRHVTVEVDDDERAILRFGDGQQGVPPTGALAISYRTGGGDVGNVAPDRLKVIESTVLDAAGRPVSLRVTNRLRASGGVHRETVAQARRRIPATVRAPSRTVAREDFEIHACQVPGVARALLLTRNEDPTIDENTGILHVVPQGGGIATPALKEAVLRQVTVVYPCTLTFQVRVQDPTYPAIDVVTRVFLAAGAAGPAVAAAVRARLAAFFAISLPDGTPNPEIDFGFHLREPQPGATPAGDLPWSRVANVVIDTPGIRKLADGQRGVLLNGEPADVPLRVRDFPVLGAVTVIRADTGEAL